VTAAEAVLVVLAGVFAGTVNTVVGSGSLVTFPVLLAVGYPALVANVSNTVGLVPGSISGSWGYRRELVGQRHRARVLGAASTTGGLTGGVLLLSLPGSVFEQVVPVLILVASGLMAAQPRITRQMARRRAAAASTGGRDGADDGPSHPDADDPGGGDPGSGIGDGTGTGDPGAGPGDPGAGPGDPGAGLRDAGAGLRDTGADGPARGTGTPVARGTGRPGGTASTGGGAERTSPLLVAGVFATGVYGGYFGAAQGIILLSLLGIFVADHLQRLNALKNVLAALVNGVAAVLFITTSDVAWEAAGLLAVGATVGGQIGAHVGRRIPAAALRIVVVVVGVVVALHFWL